MAWRRRTGRCGAEARLQKMLIFQSDMRLLAQGIRLSSKLIRSCVARGRRLPMNEARCMALPMRHIREGNRTRSTLVVLSAPAVFTFELRPRRRPPSGRGQGRASVSSSELPSRPRLDRSGAAQKSARQHGFTLANSLRPWCSSLFALQHIELPERQNGKR